MENKMSSGGFKLYTLPLLANKRSIINTNESFGLANGRQKDVSHNITLLKHLNVK
jgi:hypothetical protein